MKLNALVWMVLGQMGSMAAFVAWAAARFDGAAAVGLIFVLPLAQVALLVFVMISPFASALRYVAFGIALGAAILLFAFAPWYAGAVLLVVAALGVAGAGDPSEWRQPGNSFGGPA